MQKEFLYEAAKVDNPFDLIERDIALYGEEFLKSMNDSEFLLNYGMTRKEYLFYYRGEIADYSSNKLESVRKNTPFTEQSLTNLIDGYKSETVKHLTAIRITSGKISEKKPSDVQLNTRTSVKPSALKQKLADKTAQKINDVAETIADTVKETEDKAGEAHDTVKNQIEQTTDLVTKKAGQLKESVTTPLNSATQSISNKINEPGKIIRDKAKKAESKLNQKLAKAKSSIAEKSKKLPYPAPGINKALNNGQKAINKDFSVLKKSILKQAKGPLAKKMLNLRFKALKNAMLEGGLDWSSPEMTELTAKFFPGIDLKSLLPAQNIGEQIETAFNDGKEAVNGALSTIAPPPPENKEIPEEKGQEQQQGQEPAANIPEAEAQPKPVEDTASQADAKQTTQPDQAAQPAQKQQNKEETTPTAKADEQQSNQGTAGSSAPRSEVTPNQTAPSSEGSGGAEGGPAPTGGKNYPKTEHEPVDISKDIEGGAEAMVKGLKSTPPSQMLEAFNKKVNASKQAFEVDVDKAKETIPEIPAPTGLAPRTDDKKPEDEEKPDEAKPKSKFTAEDLKNKVPVKQKADDLLSNINFNVTQNLPTPPVGDESAEGADPENMAEEALEQINLEIDQIPEDMGPPPEVELAGEANPQIAVQSQVEAEQDVEKAAIEAQSYTQGDFGEQNILPEPDDSMIQSEVELQVQEVTAQAQEMNVPEVPPELVGELDNMLGTEMLPKIEEQQAEFQAQTEAKQAETEEQREQSSLEIEKLQEEAVKEQEAEKERANAEIESQKQGYQEEVAQMQADFEAEANQQSSATQEQVSVEREKGEAEARKHFDEAEAQAEKEKAKAEEDAQKKKDEKKKEKKGLWGKIVGAVTSVINAVKDAVNAIFEGLRSLVKGIFEAAKKLAMAAIDLATKAITGLIKAFGEILKGLVKTLFAAFPKLQEKLLNAIDKAVDAACEAVNKLAEGLKKAVTAALDFLSSVIDMALAFVQELYNIAFTAIGMIVKGEFAELGKYIIKSAINLVFGTLKQFLALLGIGTDALDKIIEDPGAFFQNLVTAVRNGINNFVSNIKKHLLNGLAGWLFGTMGDLGITLPEKFDLKGIIFLVLQILNLTWANIRAKIVKQLGPKGEAIMSGAEKVVTIVADVIQRGPIAIVDHIKDFIGDLKSMIFSSIIEWVRNTIIVKAIAKLISYFNPAGAILAVIEGIYNTVMFIKERWEQIKSFCMAVMESITKIAYGQLGEASTWVENSLARVIPVTIGFLARLIGLGGITDKIKKIITNVRKPIDKALDKVIGIVVNAIKKLGGALLGGGNRSNNANGENEPDDNKEDLEDTEVGKVVRFNADDASHKIWINATGSDAKVMVASVPMDAEERLARWSREVEDLEDADKKAKAKSLIASANSELDITEPAAKKAKKEIDEAKNGDSPQENQQATDADNIVESSEEKLSRYFEELFEIFEEDEDGGAKVSASVIHPSSIISYPNKEAKITEDRNGNKIVGYKASTKEGQNNPDGVIVGKAGSEKPYIKKRKDQGDYGSEYDTLMAMSSFEERRKHIDVTEPPHDLFEPVIISDENSGQEGKKKLKYKYKNGDQIFTVIYDNTTSLPEVVTGENLQLHSFGRGKVEGDTHELHNRAHIIADKMTGSGYKTGKNIVLTSAHYNQKDMKIVEDEIKAKLSAINNLQSFDLEVKVSYANPNNDVSIHEIKMALMNRLITLSQGEIKPGSIKEAEKKTIEALDALPLSELQTQIASNIKKIGQARCMSVIYEVKKISIIDSTTNQIIEKEPVPKIDGRVGPDLFYGIT